MSLPRILILLVALLAGGAAFVMTQLGGEQRTPLPEEMELPEVVPTTRVLFAAHDVAQGAVLDETVMSWIEWPLDSVPDFYITEDNAEFLEAIPKMRARKHIRQNEPIYWENTVQHGDKGMMAAIMTPGMRAVTAEVDIEQISGGFILPGDRVDIYASGIEAHAMSLGEENLTEARLVLADVRVLAIDQVYDADGEATSIAGSTVTVELQPGEVRPFIEARDNHNLTVVLRSIFNDERPQSRTLPKEPAEVVVIRYGQG